MAQINDARYEALVNAGYNPEHINDIMYEAWALNGQTNDDEYEFYLANSVPAGHITDMRYQFLLDNGMQAGHVNEMWQAFWVGGGFSSYDPQQVVLFGDSWAYYSGNTPSLMESFIANGYYTGVPPAGSPAPTTPPSALSGNKYATPPPSYQDSLATALTTLAAATQVGISVIGVNDISADATITTLKTRAVISLGQIEAAGGSGLRVLTTAAQPGNRTRSTPWSTAKENVYLEFKSWMAAFADGMGYDYIDLTWAEEGVVPGKMKDVYNGPGTPPGTPGSDQLHMSTAAYDTMARRVNSILRRAPLDKNTGYRQAIRNMPNKHLLTVEEMTSLKATFAVLEASPNGTLANITELYFMSSDISANGNAVTNLVSPFNKAAFVGTPTAVVGTGVSFTAGQGLTASAANLGIQGMGGLATWTQSQYNICGSVSAISAGYWHGLAIGPSPNFNVRTFVRDFSGFAAGSLPSSQWSGNTFLWQYELPSGSGFAPIVNTIALDGVNQPIAVGGQTRQIAANFTLPIKFNLINGAAIGNSLVSTWRWMAVTNGVADVSNFTEALLAGSPNF